MGTNVVDLAASEKGPLKLLTGLGAEGTGQVRALMLLQEETPEQHRGADCLRTRYSWAFPVVCGVRRIQMLSAALGHGCVMRASPPGRKNPVALRTLKVCVQAIRR